jgi:hypothetical protein
MLSSHFSIGYRHLRLNKVQYKLGRRLGLTLNNNRLKDQDREQLMEANAKQLKHKINQLRLPWWFNLVKLGIPYTLATITAFTIILVLGGWIAMPAAVPLLQWVDALFMVMQPVVRVIAVSLVGLGSFLSSLAISSVIVRGFLFPLAEKSALDGLEVGEQLLAQAKELKVNLLTENKLREQNQEQLEFLKGFSMALNGNAGEKVEKLKISQEQQQEQVQEEEEEPASEADSDQEEILLPDSEALPLSKPVPVVFRKLPSKPVLSVPSRDGLSEETEKHTKDKIALKA